jgi:protein gp37
MGERTGISWTGATWNPWHGCIKVSPGCANCYMYREKKQYGQDPMKVVRSKTKFHEPLKWREPELIFTCSWSDWFIEHADLWRDDAYGVIRSTPQHVYQILTKRSARFPHLALPDLRNIWWGVSVENRKYGVPRIAQLREGTPRNRFLSIEPLLEDIGKLELDGISWVIVGGESGPGWRPMRVPWVESIIRQCDDARVPVFVKQDAGMKSGRQGAIPDLSFRHEMPAAFERFIR